MARVRLGVFHDNTNMGATRLCVFLAVLVSGKMMAAQPTFGTKIWCDMFCDDDDDDEYDDSTSSSFEDMLEAFFDPCSGCETKKPTKSKTTTPAPASGMQQPFNIMIPPSNGMNLTMTNTGMSWLMNFIPWPAAAPAKATTAKDAKATTAAPGTTAAGTTAAAGSTTAEATTAKA